MSLAQASSPGFASIRRRVASIYDRSRGRARSARLRRPSTTRDAAVRARPARTRAQRRGLRRVDIVAGAHPQDARVGKQQVPREMTPEENRADLQRHADDFRNRKGFTYTVLDRASRDVIGCVYIYPLPDSEHDARVLSWVRASHAQLDAPLWRTVSEWLASDWPFGSVEYAPRG